MEVVSWVYSSFDRRSTSNCNHLPILKLFVISVGQVKSLGRTM